LSNSYIYLMVLVENIFTSISTSSLSTNEVGSFIEAPHTYAYGSIGGTI